MRFCSRATAYELPQLRSLADRVTEHHGTRLTALVLGRPELRTDEPFDVIDGSQLGLQG
jgi:hypothetical protein